MGAGAAHAVKREEQEEQITRDVSRTSYKIGETTFGCAMGEHVDANIREKMVSSLGIGRKAGEEGGTHVCAVSCTFSVSGDTKQLSIAAATRKCMGQLQ